MTEKIHNSAETKRTNYLSWDETFMLIAAVIGQRSKDPNTQLGACVVDENNVIVGLGYNGFPRGCSDDVLPWRRDREFKMSETKYAYVVHAEANAIYNANRSIKDCKLYCVLFPCNECAKVIIQSGVKEVIYQEDWYHNDEVCIASRKMFDLAGVKCRQYTPQHDIKKFFTPIIPLSTRQPNGSPVASTTAESPAMPQKNSAAAKNSEFVFEEII